MKKDQVGDAAYELWQKVERGDFVGAVGGAMFTRTGELTILADKAVILTKATRPLPEKWHGLQDVEIRYRQRYVDLVVNPDVREVFRKRTAIVRSIRRFLDARGFMEVETPMMHSILGGAAARPFETHHNALDLDLYMRIAPELYLKRLVVGSFERVYEIGRNFRNEGLSRQHNPEFTMLEFYQAYATYEDLMALTEELFRELAREVAGGETITYGGQSVSLASPWPRIPMKDAIVTAVGAELLPRGLERAMLDDEAALSRWIASTGLAERKDELAAVLRKSDNHGERVGALFDYAGEKALPADRPAFVTDYPAETSPLSRRNDADPGARRPLRAVHRRARARERLLRAQRPGRSARALPAPGRRQGAGARGDHGLRRGLLPGARVRAAADGGRGDRHRPPGHAAHRSAVDPRRDLVSADAARAGARAVGRRERIGPAWPPADSNGSSPGATCARSRRGDRRAR